MFTTRFTLYLGILSCVPIVMSQTNITAIVGQNASLPCLVAGTYVLPGWSRDAVAINYQGFTTIHPSYAARFQIDPSDQKSLRITGVQESDEGMYQCSYSPSPAIFTGLIVNLPTTESGKTKNKNGTKVQTANRIFFGLAEVVVTVVILICCSILINAYKKRHHNENKMEDKQNEKKKKIKVVILAIVEMLLFIIVSVWFIVIQATVEDFEKLTENEQIVTIALLVVEIVVFVQGVIAIFVFWKNRDPQKKWSVMKPKVKPQSGNTRQHHSDVSSLHRPQPALPPHERDKPVSEQSNIKTSNPGLSTVIDQHYYVPASNRLAPLDHTVMDESIKRKKKKKKTKTNNDNVKFDNDND